MELARRRSCTVSSDWNYPEMDLAGLRMHYEVALQDADKLGRFAGLAMRWAHRADAEIERRGRKQGAEVSRRELAEKVLLKLIEIAPQAFKLDDANSLTLGNGVELAWWIADAFLKAESPT